MHAHKIPYDNVTAVLLMDDAENVIAAGVFNDSEDADEAVRMATVLLTNCGILEGYSTGVLPMPYKKFRELLNSLTYTEEGERH